MTSHRHLLRAVLCSLTIPLAAVAQTIVPMEAAITVPTPASLVVRCSFLEPVELQAMCIYGTAPASPATVGGEGGCINLPGGFTGGPQLEWFLNLIVPNSPSLCGVTFFVIGVQESPLVLGGSFATVDCSGS